MRQKVINLKQEPVNKNKNKNIKTAAKSALKEKKVTRQLLFESLGLGFGLVFPIAGGALFGAYLDKTFQSAPNGVLSFITIGVLLSIRKLIQLAKREE